MSGGKRYVDILDVSEYLGGPETALPAVSPSGTYRLVFDTVDKQVKISKDGGPYLALSTGSLSHLVFVDAVQGDDSAGGIDNGVPYATMQAAVNAIVADNATAGPRTGYTIIPAPFQQFDETLTIDVSDALHLSIICQGGWMLGDFPNPAWRPVSGAGRDLVLTGDASAVDGIRPSLSIQTAAWASWNATSHEAYSGPRISGKIDGTAITGGNLEFAFEGEIFGEGSAVAVDFGASVIVSAYWRDARPKKAVTGTNLLMFKSWDCRFQGLITCSAYSAFYNCELEGGLTTAGGLAGVPPQGFYSCDLQGTFTGPASAWLLLDPASNSHALHRTVGVPQERVARLVDRVRRGDLDSRRNRVTGEHLGCGILVLDRLGDEPRVHRERQQTQQLHQSDSSGAVLGGSTSM
jgi:hypothetical protein